MEDSNKEINDYKKQSKEDYEVVSSVTTSNIQDVGLVNSISIMQEVVSSEAVVVSNTMMISESDDDDTAFKRKIMEVIQQHLSFVNMYQIMKTLKYNTKITRHRLIMLLMKYYMTTWCQSLLLMIISK